MSGSKMALIYRLPYPAFTAPLRECLNIAQGHLAAFRSTNQRRAKINFGKFLAEKTIYDAGIGHRSTAATFPIDSCPIRYISCRLRAEKIENNSADKHRPLVYRGLAATCQSTVSSFQESECNVSGAMGAEYVRRGKWPESQIISLRLQAPIM